MLARLLLVLHCPSVVPERRRGHRNLPDTAAEKRSHESNKATGWVQSQRQRCEAGQAGAPPRTLLWMVGTTALAVTPREAVSGGP